MSQLNSYNLVTEPWIPVIDMAGKPCRISLMDVFTKGRDYSDLSVRPHERVSLMRLFLCVAHAALDGPEDIEEWDKVPEILPQKAKAYLEKWKDSFDLFHKTKPFLQIYNLQNVGGGSSDAKTELSKLDYSLASGDSPTLFDHNGIEESRQIPVEYIGLLLLTYQNFSVGGLIGYSGPHRQDR